MKPRQLRSVIAAAGACAVAAIVGAAIYDGWRLHEQIMAANERELGNLAEALTTVRPCIEIPFTGVTETFPSAAAGSSVSRNIKPALAAVAVLLTVSTWATICPSPVQG